MRGVAALGESSVGKKILMATTGLILYGFVVGHMVGNLKVFLGPEVFNHYAEGLRVFGDPFFARGQLLWVVRVVLLFAVLVHIGAAVKLWLRSRAARRHPYKKFDNLAFSQASRTMVWGGITILAFVIFHLMHLTWGNVHPDFVHGDAYHNFIAGFRSWPVSLAYIAAMIPLGLHLYHGLWSAFQTMGVNDPNNNQWRRPLAMAIALVVVIGNISFPIAVLSGAIGDDVPAATAVVVE
ncbi:MAG: succinate dehydrogenase cytochrome b subunit [Gemmatimonadota bacterium]